MDKFQRTLTLNKSILLGLSSTIGAGLFLTFHLLQKLHLTLQYWGCCSQELLRLQMLVHLPNLQAFPETGGTYLYAKNVLGKYPSLIAGYSFIIGKLISCTAVALTLEIISIKKIQKLYQ